ncbi:hypothetical protein BGZ83_001744 [Gryganskiella cystojenkinii]|nr:hypothetical protein BGZ83_001744 [Gryganskiella cystojenkinii]
MEFPKIDVSSKADIQYLADIWRSKLSENLQRQPGNHVEVQELLDQWVKRMMEMSSANIDINGIPYEEAILQEDDVEPLDESLARKVQTQQALVEDLMLKVAERRKRVPEQVKMLLDDALRRQAALADRIEFESDDERDEPSEEMDDVKLERMDLVSQEYSSSLALLSGLKKTVSSNITRLEGAQAVIDETLP